MSERLISMGAAALAARLRELGWSQQRLEKELKLSRGIVSRWLAGEQGPGVTTAVLLERSIGVPIEVWADQGKLTAEGRE